MKKKILIAVAVMLVAVTACAMLVGCAPSTPDKFMETFVKKGGVSIDGESVNGIVGDKFIMKVNEKNQTILEKKGDKVNMYICVLGIWTATTIDLSKLEAETDFGNPFEDMENIKDEDIEKMISTTFGLAEGEKFKDKYEKKDGKWQLKEGGDALPKYEIKGSKMMIYAGEKVTATFDLAYKIEIPAEAKEALK